MHTNDYNPKWSCINTVSEVCDGRGAPETSFCSGKPEKSMGKSHVVWALQDGEIFIEMMAERMAGLM